MIVVGNVLQLLILGLMYKLYKKFNEFRTFKDENIKLDNEAYFYKTELDKYKAKTEELSMQVFHLTENINEHGGW